MPQPSKLLLNKPDVGLKTYVVVPKDRAEELVEGLVRKGLFEPLPPTEAGEALAVIKKRLELSEKGLTLYRELNSLIRKGVDVEVRELPWNTDEALEKLVREFESVYEVVKSLVDEVRMYEGVLERLQVLKLVVNELLSKFGFFDRSLIDYVGDYLVLKTLYGSGKDFEDLLSRALKVVTAVTVSEGRVVAVVIFERSVYESLKSYLSKFEVTVPKSLEGVVRGEELVRLDEEVKNVKGRIEVLERRISDVLESKLYELALLKVLSETVQGEVELLRNAFNSKYMTLVIGWSLKSRRNELERYVSRFNGYVVYENDPNPPVEFNNYRVFKPFELFTEIIGYPAHYEWDPTPLLTYFYLIFFSLMFPDVGYGIGLIIGARLVLPYFVESRETLKRLVNIATYAGIVGIMTGLLSRSFFGSLLGTYLSYVIPQVLPSLPARLADPEALGSTIITYIGIAMIVGYYSVLIAHGLGLIKNVVISKNVIGAILELLIIVITVLGPATVEAVFGLHTDVFGLLRLTDPKLLLYVTVSVVISYAVIRSITDRPFGALLWIFDVLGILADVLSFVRIAGIALGSAILAELINNLIFNTVSMLSSISVVIGVVVGALISSLLHIVNLGLSSLSPFVHSLRLIMYEVSSKFYEGCGRRLTPISTTLTRVRLGPTT